MKKILKKCVKDKTIWIFCVIIVLIVMSSFLFIVFFDKGKKNHSYANIYQNRVLLYSIDLYAVEKPYTITVESDEGGVNRIEIRNGSIGIIEANCPDGLCVDMGFIENGRMPITCLPNHLVIEIGKQSAQEMDGISY